MSSTKGEIDYTIEQALHMFDEWNNITGWPEKFTGYYYELKAIVEDSVKMAFNVANNEPIKKGIEINK